EGRQTLAHDILTTTHLIKGRLSIPIDFRIYLKEEQLEDKNEFRDKNQMARELIQKAHSKGIPFLYVVGDSWFFSKETAELAGSLGKIWIFESKSDRVVLMPQGWVHLSELAKTVPKEKVKPIKVRYQSSVQIYWCYETNLRMRSMGGERVRVVVSYDNPELEV